MAREVREMKENIRLFGFVDQGIGEIVPRRLVFMGPAVLTVRVVRIPEGGDRGGEDGTVCDFALAW